MDGLENAAQAFMNDLGGSEAPARSRGANQETNEPEPVFDNLEDGWDDDGDIEEPGNEGEEGDLDAETDQEGDADEGQEGDEEEEGDDEDQGEDEEAQEKGQVDLEALVQIRVDGEDVEVPLKEALQGYIRTETFHRRLNNLRDVAQTVEAEAVKVAENRDRYSSLLEELTAQLDSLAKEPDWEDLANKDPQQAFKQRLAWDKYKEQRKALDDERARVKAEKEAEEAEHLARFVQVERTKIAQNNPEWADPKVRERDMNDMVRTAREAGFSPEEIKTVYDSRMVTILKKAAAYDRMTRKKPVPVKKGVQKNVKPGSGASRTGPKASGRSAERRLAKTGSVEAAAKVFEKFV